MRSIDPDGVRAHDRGQPPRRLAHRARLPAHVIERTGYILRSRPWRPRPRAGLSAYAASKAGVEAFADSLRAEVAHHGVAVGRAPTSRGSPRRWSRGADATPASGMMRGRMRGPLAKTYPVSAAVDAIEKGSRSAPGACSPPAGSSCCWRCATSSRSSSNETWPRPCPRWSARSTRTSPPGARRVGCRWRRRGGRHQGAGTTEYGKVSS